jgi:hypothetical protein
MLLGSIAIDSNVGLQDHRRGLLVRLQILRNRLEVHRVQPFAVDLVRFVVDVANNEEAD